MKKLLSTILCVFAVSVFALRADNEKPRQVSELPAVSQQFIKQHFPDLRVALAKVETGLLSKSYDVVFTDGTNIDFDSKGNWEEIECKSVSVPEAVVPAKIMEYVRTNYPDATVKKISKDRQEYEVNLSNRVELTFDMNFKVIDIDM